MTTQDEPYQIGGRSSDRAGNQSAGLRSGYSKNKSF
jgi:hypothetical protein